MKTQDAIQYFGGKGKLALALNVRLASVYSWGEIVPFQRQHQIQDITGGRLKAMSWVKFVKYREAKRAAA